MLRHRIVPVLLLLAPLAATSARAADDAQTTADLRCVVTTLGISNGSTDEAVKRAGFLAMLYYLGRVDARAPQIDLEKRMVDELGKMTQQQILSEAGRCGTAMQTRAEEFTEIEQHFLEQAEKILGNRPNAP